MFAEAPLFCVLPLASMPSFAAPPAAEKEIGQRMAWFGAQLRKLRQPGAPAR